MLLQKEKGQAMAEYAMIFLFIVVVIISAVGLLGGALPVLYEQTTTLFQ